MTLQDLYVFADAKNYAIIQNHHFNKKAFCLQVDELEAISIDYSKIVSETEERIVLAEEVGHLETGSLYFPHNLNNPLRDSNIRKAERRARDWAIARVIPLNELLKALPYYSDLGALADYFHVDIPYMQDVFNFYHRKNLLPDYVNM